MTTQHRLMKLRQMPLKWFGLTAAGCAVCCIGPIAGGTFSAGGLLAAMADGKLAIPAVAAAGLLGVFAFFKRQPAAKVSCGCGHFGSAPEKPPIACSLSAADYEERVKGIRELSARYLVWASRDDLTLHLIYDTAAESDVRRLVDSERACCAFLSFSVSSQSDGVHLTIVAPEDARDAADPLFDHFAPDLARSQSHSTTHEEVI